MGQRLYVAGMGVRVGGVGFIGVWEYGAWARGMIMGWYR